MDRFIESFLDEFGEAELVKIPPRAYIESYRGKLPDILLNYWAEIGFCRFMNGLFWLTDPAMYSSLITPWVENSELHDLDDEFHVIARNGYGDIYIWAESTCQIYRINMLNGWIIKSDSTDGDKDHCLQMFIAGRSPYGEDIEDEDSEEEIFEEACERLGALKDDEVIRFVPDLITGGRATLKNAQKSNIDVYSDMILQLTRPKVLTTSDLAKMAF